MRSLIAVDDEEKWPADGIVTRHPPEPGPGRADRPKLGPTNAPNASGGAFIESTLSAKDSFDDRQSPSRELSTDEEHGIESTNEGHDLRENAPRRVFVLLSGKAPLLRRWS